MLQCSLMVMVHSVNLRIGVSGLPYSGLMRIKELCQDIGASDHVIGIFGILVQHPGEWVENNASNLQQCVSIAKNTVDDPLKGIAEPRVDVIEETSKSM